MTSSAPPEETLSLHQAADELGVHYMTAYRYVRLGVLPAHREGRSWRVRRADLDTLGEETPPAQDAQAGRLGSSVCPDAPWPETGRGPGRSSKPRSRPG